MEELKSNIVDLMNENNQDWVEALQKSYKEGKKVSSVEMMGKFSERMKKLNKYFREFEERIKKPRSKGFFGRN